MSCILQDQQPSATEIAEDPRLEKVIGAILSGAGQFAASLVSFRLILLLQSGNTVLPDATKSDRELKVPTSRSMSVLLYLTNAASCSSSSTHAFVVHVHSYLAARVHVWTVRAQ